MFALVDKAIPAAADVKKTTIEGVDKLLWTRRTAT